MTRLLPGAITLKDPLSVSAKKGLLKIDKENVQVMYLWCFLRLSVS